MGHAAYCKYCELAKYKSKTPSYKEFCESRYYSSFVGFGRYLTQIQALNPPSFVEFLVKAEVPFKNWHLPLVYEQFVRELNKREPSESAFERNILIMKQWELDNNEPWYDFFRKVNPNVATALIRAGRLSPWVIYTADSAIDMFDRMTDEQMTLISQYVTPIFWERKFDEHPQDVKFIKELLREVGI